MNKILKKAVIPVAGLGTRLLPATKSQPKEMLPVVDKPAVQYVVEEAVQSGIENILFVTGRGKRAIENYFDYSVELEKELEEKGKEELLGVVRNISNMISIFYVRQKQPKGLGDAILCAKKHVGEEPFAVLLGDDIIINESPGIKQLMDAYHELNASIIGLEKVTKSETSKYGIIKINEKVRMLVNCI